MSILFQYVVYIYAITYSYIIREKFIMGIKKLMGPCFAEQNVQKSITGSVLHGRQ